MLQVIKCACCILLVHKLTRFGEAEGSSVASLDLQSAWRDSQGTSMAECSVDTVT